MRPSSLLGLALELLAEASDPGPLPADARAGTFFRGRRFLGSRDRRFLSEVLYSWLRHGGRAAARWRAWAERAGLSPEPTAGAFEPRRAARLPELLALAREGRLPWSLGEALEAAQDLSGSAGGGSPRGLSRSASLLGALLDDPGAAASLLPEGCWPADPAERFGAELSLPPWLAGRLAAERGEAEARVLAEAFALAAPVDLRVNLSRVDREAARRSLEAEIGSPVAATPLSPAGLRLSRRIDLRGTSAWREGWIDVEDEGSQILAFALEARAGMTVIDACAGAGGKALALADALARDAAGREPSRGGSGRIVAADVDPVRLERLEERARRARVSVPIEIEALPAGAAPPPSVPEADLVLLDVPCTGLGALRRRPETRALYGPEDVERFRALQLEILERWCGRVKPGGRLAYATCSVLRAENEEVALAFAARHPDFVPDESRWARERIPPRCFEGASLRLDPVRTGTDGFFLALWRRAP